MSEGSLIAVKTIPQVQSRNISSLFVTTQVPMWTLRLCCNRNQVSKLSPVCSTTALGRESCDCEDLLAHLQMGCNSDRKKVITNVFFRPAQTRQTLVLFGMLFLSLQFTSLGRTPLRKTFRRQVFDSYPDASVACSSNPVYSNSCGVQK